LGGVQLAIRKFDNPEENPGKTEIVFQVKDIIRSYEELKRKQVVFGTAPRAVTSNESSDLFAADFRDPDGHILSITAWMPKAR